MYFSLLSSDADRGKSRIPGFTIASVSCRLPVCSGLLVSSAFAGPARSFFVDLLYVKVSTDFLCFCLSQTIFFCFLSVLQLLQTLRIPKSLPCPPFVKGDGFEKGRGSLLPFSVFLVPFVTSQKEHPFLFPLEKEYSSFLLEEMQVFSCLP